MSPQTSSLADTASGDARALLHPTVPSSDASQLMDRVSGTLEQLDQLAQRLNDADDYTVDPLPFAIPEGFQLSVVIPVFNEVNTIDRILARVRALPVPKEMIIVDDGSTDGTRDALRGYEQLDDVRVLLQPKNMGKGAAVRAGFQAAKGAVVVVQDADLEYDPRDIPQLIQPIVEGQADVVYGSRFLSDGLAKNSSFVHQLGNKILTWFSNRTTGLRLTDMETCYKVIRRELLDNMELNQERFGFEPEITAKLARKTRRIVELPIGYEARAWSEGKKIGIRDGLQAIQCIVRYAFG